MPIDLERSILFAAAAAMLAIAVIILSVGPGRRINRALAALIAARGFTTLLPQVSNSPNWTLTALNVQPYFVLAIVPLAVYCMHAFAQAGQPEVRRWAGWLTVAAVAALDIAYFVNHRLFHTLSPGEPSVGMLRAADGIQYVGFGPLILFASAAIPVLAYLGLRLAVQYRVDPRESAAPLFLLVSAGLVLGALFDGASRLAALSALLDDHGSFPWLPWGWAVAVLPIVGLAPAILALAVLAANGHAQRRPLYRIERAVVALAGFAFFSGFLRLLASADSNPAGNALVLLLLGVWRLATPVLIAYAILYHPMPAANARYNSAATARRLPAAPDHEPASR